MLTLTASLVGWYSFDQVGNFHYPPALDRRGSAQGIAAGILADARGKSLSLSGTLMGGYSSTLFHLLYRFSPEIRTDFGRSDEHRWI